MNFYKTNKWIKKRANVLRRDSYECRQCKRYGKTTLATTVHHVKPLETHSHLKLDSNNLLSLCNSCHGTMHSRTSHELTEIGLEWVKRTQTSTKTISQDNS
jgi:5-methylcytosine-specific restriction endonuclease McrA